MHPDGHPREPLGALIPWLSVEQFSYTPVENQSTSVELLAALEAGMSAPRVAALVVDRAATRHSYPALTRATWCRRAGKDRAIGLLWRVSFSVPLEVVEYPSALFELAATGREVLTLPAPVLAGSLYPEAANTARAVQRRGHLKRNFAAFTTSLVLATAIAPVGALAAQHSGHSVKAHHHSQVTDLGTALSGHHSLVTLVAPSPLTKSTAAAPVPAHPKWLHTNHPLPTPNQHRAAHYGSSHPGRPVVEATHGARVHPHKNHPRHPQPTTTGRHGFPSVTSHGGGKAAPPPTVSDPATTTPATESGAVAGSPAVPAPAPTPVSVPTPPAIATLGAPATPWNDGFGTNQALSAQLAQLLSSGTSDLQPPAFLIPIYKAAALRYNVPWQILAAINSIETDYGRNLSTSSAGAIGWMQFMPGTWLEYGVSADGQGQPNPYNPRDAIFSAARYLAANGAQQNVRQAIFAYNHAQWYVDDVMWRAQMIVEHATAAVEQKDGYALPLDAQYMRQLGRTDDGVDIETAPDGAAVSSITPGIVTAVASDPSGFGPNYPVIMATAGPLAGQYIYYGHVAASLVQVGQKVSAGQPIAVMGHTGDAASLGHGHIEIGFSDSGGDPLSHHGATAWTTSGAAMRGFFVALSAAFGINNS